MAADPRERASLAERLAAEQHERRRLAEHLHDGPVQQLAAISQMLDAAGQALAAGEHDRALGIVARALDVSREASGDLRELVEAIEPATLHEQGFGAAVGLLAERLRVRREVALELGIDPACAELLGENARAGLYQIVRESVDQAVRRGPPTVIGIALRPTAAGGVELVVSDDGGAERRQTVLDGLAGRAADLNATLEVDQGGEGTVVRVTLPPSAATR
jgi:two-component system NarL family sensor kinase